MPVSLRELSKRTRGLTPGHRACAGCGFPSIIRLVLGATTDPKVVANATGCMEVVTTIFPYTAWPVNWIHSLFENAAATIAGVESAYRALKRKGKVKTDKEIKFIAFGGDGGTYDIGLQSLSGALERGHNFLYVLYDNQAYMNTGIQRSSATPFGAHTTTSPAGKVIPGKLQKRKEITEIVAAHGIPYAAQASTSHWLDLQKKAEKALTVEGPAFLNVLSPCTPGWGIPDDMTVEVAKMAVETRAWPLYEVENGYYRITYKPKEYVPIEEWFKMQGRFKHLLKRPDIIAEAQRQVDETWERLLWLETRPRKEEEK
ncbi:MAG: pyruvate ferredoxin oxidoreductase [Candidatus Hydrothermae bacterium]|nr:pyruvate ferredoxin oxidoreductase [Candidatus Hydrothermae bacterium]